MYSVKEIHYTLQGEGAMTGRPAIFLRFSGCNLWTGREEDRHKAQCTFCDTDFRGTNGHLGGKYSGENLGDLIQSLWPGRKGYPYVVCTGGEPLLQLDEQLIEIFHKNGIQVGVETNGTIKAPHNLDWICVSPKAGTEVIQRSGDELKIVYPQPGIDLTEYEEWDFSHFFLQPMDSPLLKKNTQICVKYCKTHPVWKLSLQTHKFIDIP